MDPLFLLLAGSALGYVAWAWCALRQRRGRVRAAFAAIQTQLERRHAVIPPILTALEAATSGETLVLESLELACERAEVACDAHLGVRAIGAAESQINASLVSLFQALEHYPKLGADRHFAALAEELISTENRVSLARQVYTDEVKDYNDLCQQFPTNQLAKLLGCQPAEPFFLDPPLERECPAVRI